VANEQRAERQESLMKLFQLADPISETYFAKESANWKESRRFTRPGSRPKKINCGRLGHPTSSRIGSILRGAVDLQSNLKRDVTLICC